jgi:LysM repeat protein
MKIQGPFIPPSEQQGDQRKHTVRQGETLHSIAADLKITPQLLADANHIALDHTLQAGTELMLPHLSLTAEKASECGITGMPDALDKSAQGMFGFENAIGEVSPFSELNALPELTPLPTMGELTPEVPKSPISISELGPSEATDERSKKTGKG